MKKVFLSFHYAFNGLKVAFKNERNLKIYSGITALVILFGIIYQLSIIEWCLILLSIGCMFVAELINTAIERVVDLVTDQFHPLAKQAKDIAAAACLFFAITSAIIGVIIFVPKIF